jgi:hypothetical protein
MLSEKEKELIRKKILERERKILEKNNEILPAT